MRINKMASNEKRTRGRPAVYTELERKTLRRERDRANSGTKVYLGDQYVRWTKKKRKLGKTNAEFAEILLDRYESLGSSPSSSCKKSRTDKVRNTRVSVQTQTVHNAQLRVSAKTQTAHNTQVSAQTQTVHNTQDSAISGSRDIVNVPIGNQSPHVSTPGSEASSSGCGLNRTTCVSSNSQSGTEILLPIIRVPVFMPTCVLMTTVKSET